MKADTTTTTILRDALIQESEWLHDLLFYKHKKTNTFDEKGYQRWLQLEKLISML